MCEAMGKRKVHRFTAYCPQTDVCHRKGPLGTFLSEEVARKCIKDHLVNSSKHYLEEGKAKDIAASYEDLEPWTDEEESAELRKQVHSYDPGRRQRQKTSQAAAAQRTSSSSTTRRPRSPVKKEAKKEAPKDGATSSGTSDSIAAAVATAVAAILSAQSAAAPAMAGTASSSPVLMNQAADNNDSVAVISMTDNQQVAVGCAWTKAVNTIVRAEAAARKAAAYAKTCSEAFTEVAFTLKQQIDILENLGVYQPSTDS